MNVLSLSSTNIHDSTLSSSRCRIISHTLLRRFGQKAASYTLRFKRSAHVSHYTNNTKTVLARNCKEKNYNKKIKIERAQILLTSTSDSILEIANLLGFCDQSNFCKAFKQITGISPSKYRLSHINN